MMQDMPKVPLIIVIILLSATCSCGRPDSTTQEAESNDAVSKQDKETTAKLNHEDVRLFCGNCHVTPRPDSFPKSKWYDEVRRGFNFYYDSGRTDLNPPAQAFVTKYYQQFAPETLPLPDQSVALASPIQFDPILLTLSSKTSPIPIGISFIDVRPDAEQKMTDLWLSDMRSGMAFQLTTVGKDTSRNTMDVAGHIRLTYQNATSNPAATRQADLDGNGIDDLLIADLGSFLPEDHDHGKVVWIPDGTSGTPREAVTILDHVGRVAEVQVGDFDGDGRTDVVVGEFGWHKTGSLRILLNHLSTDGSITFNQILLDDRPGTIHALPTDINQDGRLDLIALISQEHEKVVAYINTPDGFTKSSLYEAPDPSWGSSGIFLTDFDNDGDTDILYTNGDSFDSYLIKPYHGVWWLENQGSMPYATHHLTAMPGVHRAIPADMDLDGDLDVVVASMLPVDALRGHDIDKFHAIAWLERRSAGEFLRHVIEYGRPDYATMAVGDLDGDGRPDIVAGVFSGDDPQGSGVAKIFWNRKSQP